MILGYETEEEISDSKSESGHVGAAYGEKILDAKMQMAVRISTHHLCIPAMHHDDWSLPV